MPKNAYTIVMEESNLVEVLPEMTTTESQTVVQNLKEQLEVTMTETETVVQDLKEPLEVTITETEVRKPQLSQEQIALNTRLQAVKEKIDAIQSMGGTEVPSLRYELKLANDKDLKKAAVSVSNLENKVAALHNSYTTNPDRKRWAAMYEDNLSIKEKVVEITNTRGELIKNGIADDKLMMRLNNTFYDIQDAVKDREDYQFACDTLAKLKPEVNALYDKMASSNRHNLAMKTGDGIISAAKRAATLPPVDGQEAVAFKEALSRLNNPSSVTSLDDARTTLFEKAEALLNLQKNKDWLIEFLRYLPKVTAARDQANSVQEVTDGIAKLKIEMENWYKQMDQAGMAAGFDKALGNAQQVVATATKIVEANTQATAESKALYARYQKIEAQIKGVQASIGKSPDKAQLDFLQALDNFLKEWQKDAPDIQTCATTLLPALEAKLTEALKTHVDKLTDEVKKMSTPDGAKGFITGKEEWEIQSLPPAEQIELLKLFRQDPNNNKLPDLNAKVLKNMRLDEKFLEFERKKREELYTKLFEKIPKDKLKKARAEWGTISWDEKKEVLQSLANAQCEAFGFNPFPVIKLVDLGGDEQHRKNGELRNDTKEIIVNINPCSSANDFEQALDLIAHENSHYYQYQLVDGLIDPVDPAIQAQVELFRMNIIPWPTNYVTIGQNNAFQKAAHLAQPIEAHAHLAGPEIAKEIVARLA